MFALHWSTKFLASDSKTIGDMAHCLEESAAWLRQLEEAGVKLHSPVHESAILVTNDPEVAAKFDMNDETDDTLHDFELSEVNYDFEHDDA